MKLWKELKRFAQPEMTGIILDRKLIIGPTNLQQIGNDHYQGRA